MDTGQSKVNLNPHGDDLVIVIPKGRLSLPEMKWFRFEAYIRVHPDVQGGVDICFPAAHVVPDEVVNGS